MAVNLKAPKASEVLPVKGVRLGTGAAGIRRNGGDDVAVLTFTSGTQCAAVFTRNRFCAAPVLVCREHLSRQAGEMRAVLVNAGNANAGNGESGLAACRATCQALSAALDCSPESVFPMSTGVILEPLPADKINAALPAIAANLSEEHWLQAAQAIMTTDTLPKAVSRQVRIAGQSVTVTGISKGAGMIRPNMGTMLAVIATDAKVPGSLLNDWVSQAADASFNRITVDGDTSTNDTFLLAATGASDASIESADSDDAKALFETILAVSQALAQAIIRDGEGASKFVTVNVTGAGSMAEASAVAYTIAHSPLVKTAFFASDPNLGRLLCAIGYAGIDDLDVGQVTLWLDDVRVASDGGRDPAYEEAAGQRVLDQAEFSVTVDLARGGIQTSVWTCDLSHDYVSINADYRS